MLFNIQGIRERLRFLGEVSVTNAEGPPVPIPNTEVKLCSGEDTLRETVRENSSMLTRAREGENPSPARKYTEKAKEKEKSEPFSLFTLTSYLKFTLLVRFRR